MRSLRITPGEFREIRIRWNLDKDIPLSKPYNIAPGKEVPVIVREGERNQMKLMRWGLVPSWAQDPSIGNRMINARAETLDQKPSFKNVLSSNRCAVPANGFYEWCMQGNRKVPWISLARIGSSSASQGYGIVATTWTTISTA